MLVLGDYSSEGPLNPGTIVNDSSGLGSQVWSNPGNAGASDDVYASVANLEAYTGSKLLKCTNFGFNIPAAAYLMGIKVEIERKGSGEWPDPAVIDFEVFLVKNGVVKTNWENMAGDRPGQDNTLEWLVDEIYFSYGEYDPWNDLDPWGAGSLWPSDVNASDFGVALSVRGNIDGQQATAYVDHVRMTVYYTMYAPDGATGSDVLKIDKEALALSDNVTGSDVLGIDKELVLLDSVTGLESLGLESLYSIEQMRERPRLKPVYLVEVELKNGGPTLYLSDRNIDYNFIRYKKYLGELARIGEDVRRADSSGLNSFITFKFWNERYPGYDYLIEIGETYPFEGADVTVKEVYLADDNTPSMAETIFKGVLDEPRDIDNVSFTCKASLVEVAKDRTWQQALINNTNWPNAYEDLGEVEPIIYGEDILVPALRVDWGARTTLVSDIDASQTTGIEASDASRLPNSGSFYVDNEILSYTSITDNVFGGVVRGTGGTTAMSHRAAYDVVEAKSQYGSLLATHGLHTVSDIIAEIRGRLWRVTSGVSAVLSGGKHLLRATEHIRVEALNDDVDIADGIEVSDNISLSRLGTEKTVIPWGASGGPNPGNVIDGSGATLNIVPSGESCGVSFPPTDYGVIDRQFIYADLVNNWRVVGGWSPEYVNAGVKTRVRFMKLGGSWGDYIIFYPTGPSGTLYDVFKVVEYSEDIGKTGSAFRTGAAIKTGGVYDTHVVDRFHAVVSGYKDPDGNYGGGGNLIERPDYVIKHFLVQVLGFALADIDTASFDAAGTSYASADYKFGFRIDRKIKPSKHLKRMAHECRSMLQYRAGKWYLDYLPDAAPAAVKTITKEELAGKFTKFTFTKTPITGLKNDLTARFKRNYSRLGLDSEWDGTSEQSDAASKAKYGTYPEEMSLKLIREQAMANSVLAHMLKQRKAPLLRVKFPVFYEHFDLVVGDTVQITNPLWTGKKFFIEQIRRTKDIAMIKGIEWY